MTGVRSYAGYIRGADGSIRVFSIIANNFSGSGGVMGQKLRALVAMLAR
jgi:D-alanyl-D-alanine carboxypeptidase